MQQRTWERSWLKKLQHDALLDGLAVRVEVRVEDSGGHDGEDRDVQDDEGIDEDGDDAEHALLHGRYYSFL